MGRDGTKDLIPNGPGERRVGRPKGMPNKTTKLLKDAILMAAELAGSNGKGKDGLVGYLKFQATENPGAFLPLLGRVLPMQIENSLSLKIEIVGGLPSRPALKQESLKMIDHIMTPESNPKAA